MNLYQANNQWSTRPDDERFENLAQMYAACKRYADGSQEKLIALKDLNITHDDTDITLQSKAGNPATLTHYAFGQLSRMCGAPCVLGAASVYVVIMCTSWST